VDVVIGDLDSISSSNKDELRQNKTEVIQYSSKKDETDLELALKLALERGSDWIRVAGALGGRVDHSLANISLLSHPMLNGLDCRFDDGVVEVTLIIDEDIITGNPGDLVSLLPWGGDCSEVITSGLQYWLNNETLYPGSSRGVSNTLIEPAAKISLAKGRLLCIHTRLS
jgi:thiamine pyrophosphokinase